MPVETIINCPGGVRLEVYPKGNDFFQAKFYPAWMDRESGGERMLYDYFHRDSFRWKGKGAHRKLVACPRSKWGAGRCRVGIIMLQMVHPKKELARYKRDCKSGKLGKKNKYAIRRIADVIAAEGKRLKKVACLGLAGINHATS